MIFKGQNRFDASIWRTGAQIPPAPYFASIIEGAVYADGFYNSPKAGSDLSAGNKCQFVPNTPMNVGEPWATIGRAANHAGRWIDIPEQSLLLRVIYGAQCRNSGGSGVIVWPNHSVKPAIEKEARLRPQQFIFRSGKTPDCTMQQEPQGWGAKRLRHPAPNSL
jgi:hypothetical protein